MRRLAALSLSVFSAGMVLGGTTGGWTPETSAPVARPAAVPVPVVHYYEGPGGDLPVVTGPFDAPAGG